MRKFRIDSFTTITDNSKPFIIAEIGHNHGGSLKKCKELIDLAAESGADAVKLQKRNNKKLFTQKLYSTPYIGRNSYGKTYGAHREALELSERAYIILKNYTMKKGLYFFATPFDFDSVDFLEKIKIPFYKVQSGDILNLSLLDRIAATGKPVIMSTGGAEMVDIQRAVSIFEAYGTELALLHCVSMYPVKAGDIRLYMLAVLRTLYKHTVIGFSSHYDGILGPLVAYMSGARIIEVHFTDSRANKGTDHAFSLTPQGLKELTHYIAGIRCMYAGNKKKTESRTEERRNIKKLMKSLYFKRAMKEGDKVGLEDIAIKSPYDEKGVSVYLLDKVINTTLTRDVKEDQLIDKDIYINMEV